MNIIGKFTAVDDGYTGSVQTLPFSGPVTLDAVKEKAGENSPDFRAFTVRARQQGRIQIGAAWKERSEGGKADLGVRLDDPSFPVPIYCRLIQLDGEESHSLIWSRN
jgi:uncharacterized protein (DUF736 family)